MRSDDEWTRARHPLRVVEARTGVPGAVLRAWERRYAAVRPHRTDGGHRLYSDADVARLRLLRLATAAGRAIGGVAALPDAALAALVREDGRAALLRPRDDAAGGLPGGAPAPRLGAELAECLDAAARLDGPRLERVLKGSALAHGAVALTDDLIVPLLARIGTLWRDGALRPAHEHLATAVVRRVLAWVGDATAAAPDAPAVVVGTPAGERHELGAMLAAAAAAGVGWRVIYLGADLPAHDLAGAARETAARGVAISAVLPPDVDGLVAEVAALAAALPPGVGLLAGGSAALTHADRLRGAGAEVLPDLPALRGWLRGAATAAPGATAAPAAAAPAAGRAA